MAAIGNGRAAGWNKLTPEQMSLIDNKFVPYASRFGSTGYVTQDAWFKAARKKADEAKHANRIQGTFWDIVTANGEPVISVDRTLEGALKAYHALPESVRRPEIEDRGRHNPNPDFHPDQSPPADALFIKVYCRALDRGADDKLTIAHRVDLTEFGGRAHGNSLPGRLQEPQREWLWVTADEAKALAPGTRLPGETYAVPAAVRQRLFLFYLYNWHSNSGGGYWGPRLLKHGELKLTVQERAQDRIRLKLEGSALFDGLIGKGMPPHGGNMYGPHPESGQKGVPDPYEIRYDARLLGIVEYDQKAGKFTRFDAVALGDYQGHWGLALKVIPVPVAFAFQLDTRNVPPEGRHAPFALTALRDFYWSADKWTGKR
jgi:hypothetical protein